MSTVNNTPTSAPAPSAAKTREGAPWVTVMIREIMVKLTDKTFILTTLASLGMVIAMSLGSAFFASQHKTTKVATTTEGVAVVNAMKAAAGEDHTVQLVQVNDRAAAEQKLRDGDADVALFRATSGAGAWDLIAKDSVSDSTLQLTNQTLSSMAMATTAQKAGTDLGTLTKESTANPVSLEVESKRGVAATVLTFAFAILFVMAMMTYGMQIAQSVLEEKQSRIVEILVSAIPVRQLLTGKILGNTIMALGQMVLLAVVGLIGVMFTPMKEMLPLIGQSVLWFLLLFVAGFIALAAVWAAAGALGTRSEDLQYTSQPLIWAVMAIYMAGFMAQGSFRTIMSYVPVASTIVMPARIAEGTAQWWEGLLALVLNLIFAAVTVWFGERVYRRALLRTNKRMSFREALVAKD